MIINLYHHDLCHLLRNVYCTHTLPTLNMFQSIIGSALLTKIHYTTKSHLFETQTMQAFGKPVEGASEMLYSRWKPANVSETSDSNSSWTTEQLNASNSGRALPHSFDGEFSPWQPIWNSSFPHT